MSQPDNPTRPGQARPTTEPDLDIVPDASKSAARPSEAERIKEILEQKKKNPPVPVPEKS